MDAMGKGGGHGAGTQATHMGEGQQKRNEDQFVGPTAASFVRGTAAHTGTTHTTATCPMADGGKSGTGSEAKGHGATSSIPGNVIPAPTRMEVRAPRRMSHGVKTLNQGDPWWAWATGSLIQKFMCFQAPPSGMRPHLLCPAKAQPKRQLEERTWFSSGQPGFHKFDIPKSKCQASHFGSYYSKAVALALAVVRAGDPCVCCGRLLLCVQTSTAVKTQKCLGPEETYL